MHWLYNLVSIISVFSLISSIILNLSIKFSTKKKIKNNLQTFIVRKLLEYGADSQKRKSALSIRITNFYYIKITFSM